MVCTRAIFIVIFLFSRYSSSGDSHSFDLWWLFVRMTEMQCMFVEVIALVHMSCNNLLEAENCF